MNTDEPLIIEIDTGPDTPTQVGRILQRLWASHPGVPEVVRFHMDLAASEIAANIVEHSGGGRPVRLRVQAAVSGNEVRTTFTDDGRPAQVDLASVRMPAEMAERGRGLALAIEVLDELSYRRDQDRNHWTLVRRLAG